MRLTAYFQVLEFFSTAFQVVFTLLGCAVHTLCISVAYLTLVTGLRAPGAVPAWRVQAGRAAADVVATLVAGLGPLPRPRIGLDTRVREAFPRTLEGTPAAQLLPCFVLVDGHQARLLGWLLGPVADTLVPAAPGGVAGAGLVPRAVLPSLAVAEDTVHIQCFSHGLPAAAPAPAAAAVAAAFTPRVKATVCLVPGAAVALHQAAQGGLFPWTRSRGPPHTRALHRRPARGGGVLFVRPPPLTGRRGATAVLPEAVWGRR